MMYARISANLSCEMTAKTSYLMIGEFIIFILDKTQKNQVSLSGQAPCCSLM